MLDGINLEVKYGYCIARPTFTVEIVPSKRDPIWVFILVFVWLVLKVAIVVSGTLLLAAALSLSFPQYAFPLGMCSGIIGFAAWNVLP